jgi:hypothetical protein
VILRVTVDALAWQSGRRALALIVANFLQGPPHSRATSVYAAVSALASAVGLVVGGLLVTYASWRWTLIVNALIAIVLALAASLVLTEPARQSGRFDLPGAVTSAGGIAALVYGLSAAAPSGAFDVSHWASAQVIAALAGAVVLLVAFAVIEARSSHPLLPLRILADRNRSAGYLSAAAVGVVIFAVLYFATLFFQQVWGLLGPQIQRRLPALDRGLRHRRRRERSAAAPHRAPPADGW